MTAYKLPSVEYQAQLAEDSRLCLAEYALVKAARDGDEAAMRQCHAELWATYAHKVGRIKSVVRRAMIHAAFGGHTGAMRLCRDEWGAAVDEQALQAAVERYPNENPDVAWVAVTGQWTYAAAAGDA